MSRHTSTPEIFGSITSSSTSAGRVASKRAIASGPSAAVSTRKPSRWSATDSASRYDCSSSTTRISGGSAITTPPGTERRTRGRVRCRCGHLQRERRALTFTRLDRDVAAVRLGDVADDRETETGTAGVAAARPVDPVEALEDAFEVARRDPDPVVAHGEHEPVADDVGTDLDRLVRARVLDRVVEQVHERAAHLAAVARRLDVGRVVRRRDRDLGERRRPPARDRPSPRSAAAPGSARGVGASCASIWLRSSRSSTIRDRRSASRTTRSASCCTTAASSVAAIVSASRPSAPIGVFSSWLTLATKSRRTLSTRRASDTSRVNATAPTTSPSRRSGNERSWSTWRGGP